MTHIDLQGALNVRELSGYVADDGRRLVGGRLFRGDSLHKLVDEDLSVLDKLGVRTVVDFRSPAEIDQGGRDRLPAGVERIHLPIDAGDLGQVMRTVQGNVSGSEQALGEGRSARLMCDLNRQFVADPQVRAAFAAALRLIAAPERGPLLFHCSAGKDRTGWMAAVVLTALGVPRGDVIADYLASNDYIWSSYRVWFADAVASGKIADIEPVRELLQQDPSYLAAAFDEVEARYGDFDRFLTDGLEFSAADRERLRRTLLG
jgi:protein-tyrosine phosphatase